MACFVSRNESSDRLLGCRAVRSGLDAMQQIFGVKMTIQRIVVLVGCLLAMAVLGCGGGNSEEERKAQALARIHRRRASG